MQMPVGMGPMEEPSWRRNNTMAIPMPRKFAIEALREKAREMGITGAPEIHEHRARPDDNEQLLVLVVNGQPVAEESYRPLSEHPEYT